MDRNWTTSPPSSSIPTGPSPHSGAGRHPPCACPCCPSAPLPFRRRPATVVSPSSPPPPVVALSPAVSECRSVEQCRGSVGAVSGQCRGSVGAVSVDTGVGVSGCRDSVGIVSEQCRSSVGAVSGALDVGHPRMASSSVGVSECRSVGVSRSVEECRSVRVSECRSVGWVSVG